MHQIDIAQAKEHLDELIEMVKRGEEVAIAIDFKPVVKLVPVKRRLQAGSAKGLITISDDFDEPLEDFKDYM